MFEGEAGSLPYGLGFFAFLCERCTERSGKGCWLMMLHVIVRAWEAVVRVERRESGRWMHGNIFAINLRPSRMYTTSDDNPPQAAIPHFTANSTDAAV